MCDDAGFSAVSTLLKLVVFLGIPGVLAFDALSCVVNDGLADGIAEGAARSAGNSVPDRGTTHQAAYDQAAAYLARDYAFLGDLVPKHAVHGVRRKVVGG